MFLTELFGNERGNGFYLDIGCFHPITFSNTYIFYKRGWRGIAIDANDAWTKDWRRYRRGDCFIQAALAPAPRDMIYVQELARPNCNHLVPTDEFDPKAYAKSEFKARKIACEPLGAILDRNNCPRRIDLLSIDCEGMDLAILESLDFRKYDIHVIAVEDHERVLNSPVNAFLVTNGFEIKATIGLTKIFQSTSRN